MLGTGRGVYQKKEDLRNILLTSLLVLDLGTLPHCLGFGWEATLLTLTHIYWLLCDFDKPPATLAPFSPGTTRGRRPGDLAGAFQLWTKCMA